MALQTSGAISLNDIHIEAGGSSGTNASINDADIRGLISKASGATMSFSEWYGASSLITLAAQSSNTTGPTTSNSVTLPTFAAGDIAVATFNVSREIFSGTGSMTVIAPSGWTAVTSSQYFNIGPYTKGEYHLISGLLVCYKVLTSGDTTMTVGHSSTIGSNPIYMTTVQIYRPSSTPSTVSANDVSTASSNTINCSAASSSVIMFGATIQKTTGISHTWGSGPTYNNQLSINYGSGRTTLYMRGSSHFQSTASPSNVTWSSSVIADNKYVSGYLEVS